MWHSCNLHTDWEASAAALENEKKRSLTWHLIADPHLRVCAARGRHELRHHLPDAAVLRRTPCAGESACGHLGAAAAAGPGRSGGADNKLRGARQLTASRTRGAGSLSSLSATYLVRPGGVPGRISRRMIGLPLTDRKRRCRGLKRCLLLIHGGNAPVVLVESRLKSLSQSWQSQQHSASLRNVTLQCVRTSRYRARCN